jgi:outer membrane receptor protein involved in Fe transport
VKAENSTSFDFGVEHSFLDLGLGIDVSYFKIEYDDTLEGWKKDGAFKTLNHPGEVSSQGIELVSKWKKSEMLNFMFNYTYSSTYDGADHDNENKTATSFTDTKMVAVPRHAFNLVTAFKLPGYENLDLTFNTKYSDTMRDYGSGNKTFNDVELDDFLVNDLSLKYNYLNSYNLFFDINNILNEGYETRDYYNQLGRTFNFGIKRSY